MNNRLVVAFLLGFGATTLMYGQTSNTKILLAFNGPNGADPTGGLVRDALGNLYGTTAFGGDLSCVHGCGIVFKLDPSGNETILHQFTGPDGANPLAGMIRDTTGDLYGTTWYGGTFGQGTVFEIDTTGKETVLYNFSGASGANSVSPSGLVADPEGNLYGTTSGGGLMTSSGGTLLCSDGCGTVFRVDPTGKETVVYNFKGGTDGIPQGGVVLDTAGNLYGTTFQGGAFGCGTVFKLDTSGRKTILYSFTGGADGGLPTAGVILDPAGNMYGTTSGGGIGSAGSSSANRGYGTLFKIDTTGKETTLYSFTGGMDGSTPVAGVIRDGTGNLYGTTEFGGVACAVYVTSGCGTVFKVDVTGEKTTLSAIALPYEGFPAAGLILDAEGNLYGTVQGANNDGEILIGAVFEVLHAASPKPVVIVVPGVGASTLTDANQNDQWLSCTSIQLLNQGLNLNALQYDKFGNPATQLTPRDILTDKDAIGAMVLPSNESVIDCKTSDLVNLACVAGPLSCLLARGDNSRTNLQERIVAASAGTLLQFNNPTPSQSLLANLTSNGYTPQPWPYDFRRDLALLGDDLYAEVRQVSAAYPARPVFVISHSEGSLITAAMLKQHPDVHMTGTLGGVISLGAPFGGALDSYLYLQGWKAFTQFLSAPNTAALGNNWTSVYELLPQQPFISPTSGPSPSLSQIFQGTFDAVTFPALPRASIVPNTSEPSSLWGEISNLETQPFWTAFIGYGQLTDQSIVQAFTPQYYSKPCYRIQESDGDGTVPLASAESSRIPGSAIYVNETHPQLPNNSAVISGILNILNGTSALTVPGLSAAPPPAIIFQDTILINACSPLSISATDSNGEVVSAEMSQIPGASYAKVGSETQMLLPWNGTFQIQIIGTGSGTFDLVVSAIGGQNPSATYSYKAVPVLKGSQGNMLVGGTSIPTLQYNYAGENIIDTIPADVTPPTIVCTGGYFIIQNLRATFGFNVGYSGGVSTFTYNYRSGTQTVQFVSTVTSQISVSGSTANFSGHGTLNGQSGYDFAVQATDGGGPGSGLDTVAVTITGPNGYSYSANATVIGGDVIVH